MGDVNTYPELMEMEMERDDATLSEDSDDETRGVTLMKEIDLMRARGETLHVELSDEGHALGESGSKYRSYLGVLSRSKVPIMYKTWRTVPEEIKNQIWDNVTTVFLGLEKKKTDELKVAGRMWRNFKTKLATNYIFHSENESENTTTEKKKRKKKIHKDPLKRYPFLEQEMWDEFVKSRQTPEFLAQRKLQKERQKKNIYPHTMSRGGYGLLEENLKKEKLKELKDSGIEDISLSSIDIPLHVKWKRGRLKKGTEAYCNKEIEVVAKKIDELEEQASQGSILGSGSHDILKVALSTEEPPSCIGDSGATDFKMYTREELDAYVSETVRSKMLMMMKQMGYQPYIQPSQSFQASTQGEQEHQDLGMNTIKTAKKKRNAAESTGASPTHMESVGSLQQSEDPVKNHGEIIAKNRKKRMILTSTIEELKAQARLKLQNADKLRNSHNELTTKIQQLESELLHLQQERTEVDSLLATSEKELCDLTERISGLEDVAVDVQACIGEMIR